MEDVHGADSGAANAPKEENKEPVPKKMYVISVDVGTTSVRSHVYTQQGTIKGTSSRKIEIISPKPGMTEMDPEKLYTHVVDCVKESIQASGLAVEDITCMGITTQRNTFTLWDRETGKLYHNFLTWQDLRARNYVKEWNDSYTLKALNSGSKFLHMFTRKKRYLAASVLKFMSAQVTLRLIWLLDNVNQLRQRACDGLVMFGCIETWLLWKLTKGKVHATDYSCASGTGLFDPFQIEWSTIVCNLVNIPMSIFPEVKATSGFFGSTDLSIFGTEIPITAVAGDQTAAMFGQCCFDVGDIKCTMGTGTFIDVNTGSKPHASVAGLYPLIGWKIGDEITYVAEGRSNDTGITIEWGKSLGLFEDVNDIDQLVQSVPDSDGVYFISAFSGLQAPINDDRATSLIIGMQPTTTKAHIVRALMESIAFRFKLLYETVLMETKLPLSHIRVDGGVTNNEFVVQLMADITNQSVDRAKQTGDMTSLGVAFLAGLATGVWKDKEELKKIRKSEKVFNPNPTWPKYKQIFHQWERALARSRQWYKEDS
ncbi:hypothetical protein CHS0354_001238 [Potamilus streckersoni]|uniref:Glycerol kinase 5 n=1 Tax=Potamilus streckersoni TaxID=2493646 RepID=A0AAE0S3W9_9BIVA|nr:hypothetical protein CHS0354_001238 [Potamilus streckersoni]